MREVVITYHCDQCDKIILEDPVVEVKITIEKSLYVTDLCDVCLNIFKASLRPAPRMKTTRKKTRSTRKASE